MTAAQAVPETDAAAERWLAVHDLRKQYGAIRAAAGIDFDVRAGEVHGLIGPNGAGKSTLVKMISGVVPPDVGTITVDGREIGLATPVAAQSHGIVLMPQELAVVLDRDLVDNITLGAEPSRWGLRSRSDSRSRARAALDAIGLPVKTTALAGSLSAAEKRMLMLARALDRAPRLLILDEPTAGLPPREAALVTATVRRVAERGITVLYVSHHLSEVAELCDRVTCIRGGRVVATMSGDEISRDALLALMLPAAPDKSDDGGAPTLRKATSVVDADPLTTDALGSPGVEVSGIGGERLDDVSFRAPVGQVTGVTGLLGSGLAELLSVLTGSATPGRGEVLVHGSLVDFRTPADALAAGVAYAAGDRARVALTQLSIRHNVSISALPKWFGRSGIVRLRTEAQRTDDCLAAFTVTADPKLPLSALSGGNQQRALMARLVAADASVLILDEPTVGVDVAARADIWATVRTLAAERTVVLASSEPEELVALCDRVVCLRHGAVSAVLTDDQISEQNIARAIA